MAHQMGSVAPKATQANGGLDAVIDAAGVDALNANAAVIDAAAADLFLDDVRYGNCVAFGGNVAQAVFTAVDIIRDMGDAVDFSPINGQANSGAQWAKALALMDNPAAIQAECEAVQSRVDAALWAKAEAEASIAAAIAANGEAEAWEAHLASKKPSCRWDWEVRRPRNAARKAFAVHGKQGSVIADAVQAAVPGIPRQQAARAALAAIQGK